MTRAVSKRMLRYPKEKEQKNARRAELITMLGGKCEGCGSKEALAFDHVDGRNWEMNKKNQMQRLRIIEREIKLGVRIRLLCDVCNTKHRWGHLPQTKINMERLFKYNEPEEKEEIPF